MTRVSLTEDYDDRSVISKLNEMDKRVKENASVVTSAEASARQSAQSAQETADRFAGSVGAVVQNANAQINASKVLVDQAKAEVDETVTTVAQAVQTANNASASAQQSATTVATYGTRLTAVEDKARDNKASIDHLDIETLDLYDRDANNVKLHADYQQNVTGALVFNGADKLIVKDAPNFGKSVTVRHNDVELGQSPDNARYWNEIIGVDKNGSTLWQIEYDHISNGDANLALNLMRDDSSTKSGITITKRNDVIIPQVTNLPSGAPSTSIVNKAYVEATDGTTNNLMHTIGDEFVKGLKTFETPIMTVPRNTIRALGWSHIFDFKSNTVVTLLITSGDNIIIAHSAGWASPFKQIVFGSTGRPYREAFRTCITADGTHEVWFNAAYGSWARGRILHTGTGDSIGNNNALEFKFAINQSEPVVGETYTDVIKSTNMGIVL